jgi:pimeloyl-ACP methyl ester carboxylesterase
MLASPVRKAVRFASGDADCAAWYYPTRDGSCVVMAGGLGVTKEPGTDRFARRFHEAGFGVLAFDQRNFGESGGHDRQVMRLGNQLDDWAAAIAFAASLPGVDPARIAVWSFSLSGGQIFQVAARHPELGAAVAQMPLADGRAAARAAMRHQTVPALVRTLGIALADACGALLGRPPRLLPLTGEPGTPAALTTPDGRISPSPLDPDGSYSDWEQTIAARMMLAVGGFRPGRAARDIRCPLLLVVCDEDQSVLAAPALKVAAEAPHAELLRVPGGHYSPFLQSHETVVATEVDFLRRHLSPDGPH